MILIFLCLLINKVFIILVMLIKVFVIEIRIVKKLLGIRNLIGISFIKVKMIKYWYIFEIIFIIKLLKKDMVKGGINKNIMILIEIIKIIGLLSEMIWFSGEFLLVISKIMIDIISVRKIKENFFNNVIIFF